MNYHKLLEKVNEYTLAYYKMHDDSRLHYHNSKHTKYVVDKATQIANHYQLSDDDFFIVLSAAWFHDLGYMVDLQNHEEESASIAENFFKDNKAKESEVAAIKECIVATKMPQAPANLLQQIICDADLYHLGTEDFFDKDKQLFKEVRVLYNPDLSKLDWRRKSIKFLEEHHYHTDYCRLLLNSGKTQNITLLQTKVDTSVNKNDEETVVVQPASGNDQDIKAEKKKKSERPEKGIETMFRISSSNHQRLSDMADNKAHIMITVNSIILSAIISLLLRKLTEYEYLSIPTFIFLCVSLLAMTFSILATRPSIPEGTFSIEDVDTKKVNLLFFGNFYRMSLEDYKYGMGKMMEDREFLYGSLIRDVYAQGVVLGKKYRLLRIAYNIFMFGLIISVLAFIIASATYRHK
ncbi:HD domain-containing protein [Inquilinus sp. KBS0705]|nr:HD domain-containing protein [Inquilinus sp. KBS0705]